MNKNKIPMLLESDLIEIGFEKIEHFTITKTLIYKLSRNRQLSVGDVGTPNEMLWICEIDEDNSKKITDLVCLHNYDYDGYLTKDKIINLIKYIGGTSESMFDIPDISDESIKIKANEYFESLCINKKSSSYPIKGFIAGAKFMRSLMIEELWKSVADSNFNQPLDKPIVL